MNDALRTRMQELKDLSAVLNLASWDQETFLPKKGEPARASQLATLQGLSHQQLVDPRLGEWLEAAAVTGPDEAAMVRVLRLERDRAVKVPSRLVKELAETQSLALGVWRQAREDQRVGPFLPLLERLVALRREQADAWGHQGERYDALLEAYEPGMRVARLEPVLQRLAGQLVPMVRTLDARPPPPDVFAGKRFPVEAQWRFTLELLKAMGFDLEAGRQDKSVHPFTMGLHPRDVRLTTRLHEDNPISAIFGTLHEGGHGLYEQGFPEAFHRTTLAQAPSMGLHESQSRLWENLVGRSQSFWEHFLPRLKEHFPEQLAGVSVEAFCASVNRVERSLVRVEADEVTYNLHISLRFELELALMRGQLQVNDAEAAWNDKTRALLGLEVKSPAQGLLQDIHWAYGEFGYFPTYALGNLYSASLFAQAQRDVVGLEAGLARGELAPLLGWLRAKVHSQGYRKEAEPLVQEVTGSGLTDRDFVDFLKGKYGALYGVSLR